MAGLGLGAATAVIGARREAFLARLLERPARDALSSSEFCGRQDGALAFGARESQAGRVHAHYPAGSPYTRSLIREGWCQQLASRHRGSLAKVLGRAPRGAWFERLAHSSLKPSMSGLSLASGSTGRKSGWGGGTSPWKMLNDRRGESAARPDVSNGFLPPVHSGVIYNNLQIADQLRTRTPKEDQRLYTL